MLPKDSTLLSLTGGTYLKQRVQHPEIHERVERGVPYFYFRYYHDELMPDGSVKTTRRRHVCGPSKGKDKITHTRAEQIRDEFLHERNVAASRPQATVKTREPIDVNQILFGKLAELWRKDHVEKVAAGRHVIAKPTREVYINALDKHILARWKDTRLADLRAKEVLEWLQEEAKSWHMMAQLRGS
jgi:hypothetical protein